QVSKGEPQSGVRRVRRVERRLPDRREAVDVVGGGLEPFAVGGPQRTNERICLGLESPAVAPREPPGGLGVETPLFLPDATAVVGIRDKRGRTPADDDRRRRLVGAVAR